MKNRQLKNRYRVTLAGVAGALLAVGCAGAPVENQVSTSEEGARIWRVTCARCHNMRAPTEFAAEQWPTIVSHMRTRQDLTKSEAEAVTIFLQELAAR